jgi:hypothetical protein
VQQQEAAAAGAAAAAAGEQSDSEERVPPGCARYTVKIPKPLGMVLEEGPGGRGVFVVSGGSGCGGTAGLRLAPRRLQLSSAPLHPPATLQAEVFPEGNAALLAPEISVGDELIATSGLTYTTQQVAPAARPLPAPSTRFLFPAPVCPNPNTSHQNPDYSRQHRLALLPCVADIPRQRGAGRCGAGLPLRSCPALLCPLCVAPAGPPVHAGRHARSAFPCHTQRTLLLLLACLQGRLMCGSMCATTISKQ